MEWLKPLRPHLRGCGHTGNPRSRLLDRGSHPPSIIEYDVSTCHTPEDACRLAQRQSPIARAHLACGRTRSGESGRHACLLLEHRSDSRKSAHEASVARLLTPKMLSTDRAIAQCGIRGLPQVSVVDAFAFASTPSSPSTGTAPIDIGTGVVHAWVWGRL
jgi:hypothetical protein